MGYDWMSWRWRTISSIASYIWRGLYGIRNRIEMSLYSLMICIMMVLNVEAWRNQQRVRISRRIVILVGVVHWIHHLWLIKSSDCSTSWSNICMFNIIYRYGI